MGVVFPGGKAAPPVRHAQVHAFVTVPSWFRFPFLPKPCSTWGRLRPRDSDRTGCCRPFPHPRGGGCVPGTVRIRFKRAMRFHVARSRPLRSVVWVVLPFDRGFERTGRSGDTNRPGFEREGCTVGKDARDRWNRRDGCPFVSPKKRGFFPGNAKTKGSIGWKGKVHGKGANPVIHPTLVLHGIHSRTGMESYHRQGRVRRPALPKELAEIPIGGHNGCVNGGGDTV